MANPIPSEVFTNIPLTNVAVAFMQDETKYIADKVFPSVPTDLQGGLYYKFVQDDFYRIEARERAPGTETAGGGFKITSDTFYNRVFGFHKDIDDQTRAAYTVALPLETAATRYVMQQNLMKREFDWAAKYFVSGVWGTDVTGVATGPTGNQTLQWDNANATPINDIKKYIRRMAETTGFKPNMLVLGPYVVDALENNASVLDRIKYTERGMVTTDLLASLFGVPNVLVAEAVSNSASEGATAAYSYFFGKSALLCYSAPAPSVEVPSAGYTFTWRGYTGMNDAGVRIKKFRMEQIESDRVEGTVSYDQKVVAPSLGTFFSTAIS